MRSLLTLTLGLGIWAACTSSTAVHGQEEILVLEVAPDSVRCVGESVGRCLQVRSPGEQEWRTFHSPIEGFRHERGYRFVLTVGRRPVPNPPADGAAFAYRLIRIVSRERADGGGP